ncbi:MAG: cytochrome c oxidase subunit 3 [Planctomycetia bacterium]|nr:cytochrome c oxidase subunit 3 [Planctomycetia bacterium]
MSAAPPNIAVFPTPPSITSEPNLNGPQWGMVAFLVSEFAFFSTLLVAYVTFMGQDTHGPTPAEALSLPLVVGNTLCLLLSSVVIHHAEKALDSGSQTKFRLWWLATIILGGVFLAGTAYEWHDLIVHKRLTISRNLFGTSFFTLVGFHALHVSMGVIAMLIVFGLAMRGEVAGPRHTGVQLIAWYWHFVDVVWVAVFLLVYVIGRSTGA